jgi:hypothetical protein
MFGCVTFSLRKLKEAFKSESQTKLQWEQTKLEEYREPSFPQLEQVWEAI